MTFRDQTQPFPKDLMEEIRKEFAGVRGRVEAAMAARPREVTLEAVLAQAKKFSKLSGKNAQQRKSIS